MDNCALSVSSHFYWRRLREAIECLKRALIGADPHETTINLKLAKLHNDLEEWTEATAYHRRVVEVCRANGKCFFLMHLIYDLNPIKMTARPIPDYAKSSLYVARHQMAAADGDLGLAQDYLERVAASNSEEVGQATEMLKKVKSMVTTKPQTDSGTADRKTADNAPGDEPSMSLE